MDTFRLETIGELHPLATHLFIPFAIVRLQEQPEDTKAIFTVELRNIGRTVAAKHSLLLYWDRESIPQQPLAIQAHSITEWAALALANIVVWHFANLRLHAVATAGDRFDYWVMQENQEFGLEVSGTTTDDLESRHREKTAQLLENPFGVDGYVVVVGFQTRHIIFSFHRFEEVSHESV